MAKLEALPSMAVIDQLAGVIDFYLWKGIPCARVWPRERSVPFTPQERAAWPVFADASRLWNTLDTSVQAAYNTMAAGSTLSGRDLMTKLYINAKSVLPY